MTAPNPDLLFFFGDRCPFTKKVCTDQRAAFLMLCEQVEPAVADMESELKTKVRMLIPDSMRPFAFCDGRGVCR